MIVGLCLIAAIGAAAAGWTCENSTTIDIGRIPGTVKWTTAICSGTAQGDPFKVGPLRMNLVEADLASPSVRLTPLMAAKNESYLQMLNEMAAQNPRVIAGVNGGYFYRTDTSSFRDEVCRGKTRDDALKNNTGDCSGDNANFGVSDGLLRINGVTLGCNCDHPGYSVPAVFVINGTNSSIVKLSRGESLPRSVLNCIAAGPSLVENGKVTIDPKDDNINIFEHAANTAVGLRGSQALLVTFDGHDGSTLFNPTSGINARQLGDFLVNHLQATTAMGMDQGGSTTMYVRGQGVNGIVSCSDTTSPTDAPRRVFDGLFVELL
eukprot:m.232859 g.232859  ORF g.232859 m.232859 type:complete len:321 (+) comp18893_c0_seq1:20-982(+)